ncbi:MAG: tetratricopeptide repeat protein [Chlamydiia bacterium]|nr:tetratricopeptide repeat protein [Chlamydiia bacterium]
MACLLTGCHQKSCCFEPCVEYAATERDLAQLESPFSPLNALEKGADWGRELRMGQAFAKEMDLYRALTCFKRAHLLIPRENSTRILQIDFSVFMCYYVAGKWQEAVEWFEKSTLVAVTPAFPAYGSLLIMLQDAYQMDRREEKAEHYLRLLNEGSEEAARDLELSHLLREGCAESAQCLALREKPLCEVSQTLEAFFKCKKSVRTAQWLNALLPGAGYSYVGLHRTALTSFALNSLFIAAAYRFFERGDVAAGIFTSSLEFGWYFGGINGAGLAAKEYNEALYSRMMRPVMLKQRLFPILMVEFGF